MLPMRFNGPTHVRQVQHMQKHSEKQESLCTDPSLRYLVLALHFGPWETSSQQPHHFLLCQFLKSSQRDAACKVSCLDFNAYVHVLQVFELPLQSVWFGKKFSWPAAARQQQVCCEPLTWEGGAHSAAFPGKESKWLQTMVLHL